MKLTSYKKILEMGKEAIDKALVPIRAKQAKSQGELEKMKIEEQIITLEAEITELTTKHPLPYSQIIDKLDKLGILERRKKQFDKIIEELFGEE